jgi:hypothetical protein
MSFEYQVKSEKDKYVKIEKELDKLKTERAKWETKAQAVEAELSVRIEMLRLNGLKNFKYPSISDIEEVSRESEENF